MKKPVLAEIATLRYKGVPYLEVESLVRALREMALEILDYNKAGNPELKMASYTVSSLANEIEDGIENIKWPK